MRFDRRSRFLLAAALAGALCAGTASAHVRRSREPRPLREPQPTLVTPWDDLEKLLDDMRKLDLLQPLSPPAEHAGATGDFLLPLSVEIEQDSVPSALASSPACAPRPLRLEP